jgi:hypothetical protein
MEENEREALNERPCRRIQVSAIKRSKKFDADALASIGHPMIREHGVTPIRVTPSAGFGKPPRADLWLYQLRPNPLNMHTALSVRRELK